MSRVSIQDGFRGPLGGVFGEDTMETGQTRLNGEIGCTHGAERGQRCAACERQDAPPKAIPVERPFGQHSKRHRRADMECVRCGRPTPDPKWWAHVIDGGARYALTTTLIESIGEAGDMGWFPVGTECRKLLAQAGVVLNLTPWLR